MHASHKFTDWQFILTTPVMDAFNECGNTSILAVSGVVLAGGVYSFAAYETLSGRSPGSYVPLVSLVPILLLSNNYKLLISVLDAMLPSKLTKAFFVLSYLGGLLFQAACAGKYDLRIVAALALCNLLTICISFKYRKLDHKSLLMQCKTQQALSEVVNKAAQETVG